MQEQNEGITSFDVKLSIGLSSSPITPFDIVLPTMQSSVGVTKMHWKQAHSERWTVSPLVNIKPTVEMLTDDVVLIKSIYDQAWNPVRTERKKTISHACYITFDRSYVVWYYSQKLQELVDSDDKLLYDISQECGMDIQNDLRKFSNPLTSEAQLEQVKVWADNLGYRVHKKEPKKTKDKPVSFKIT